MGAPGGALNIVLFKVIKGQQVFIHFKVECSYPIGLSARIKTGDSWGKPDLEQVMTSCPGSLKASLLSQNVSESMLFIG